MYFIGCQTTQLQIRLAYFLYFYLFNTREVDSYFDNGLPQGCNHKYRQQQHTVFYNLPIIFGFEKKLNLPKQIIGKTITSNNKYTVQLYNYIHEFLFTIEQIKNSFIISLLLLYMFCCKGKSVPVNRNSLLKKFDMQTVLYVLTL